MLDPADRLKRSRGATRLALLPNRAAEARYRDLQTGRWTARHAPSRGWDVHVWIREEVPEISLLGPTAGPGGLAIPEAFWYPVEGRRSGGRLRKAAHVPSYWSEFSQGGSLTRISAAGRAGVGGRHRGRRFFVTMATILLVAVVVGFARTFYLRPFLDLPDMPVHLQVHGVVLTAWFVFLVVQVVLVRSGRVPLHRRLGHYGAVLAVAVVAVSLLTVAHRDAPFIDEAPFRGFGNLMSVVAFSICVGFAVFLRRRPAAHKRLMLLGSIIITGPALDRMAQLPILAGFLGPILPDALGSTGVAFAALATPSLMLALVGYDVVTRKRPHWATLGGMAGIFVLAPAMSAGFMYSGLWSAFVRLVT